MSSFSSGGAPYAMHEASGRRLARQTTSHGSGDGDGDAERQTQPPQKQTRFASSRTQPRVPAAVGPAKIISLMEAKRWLG
ncbi:hypothetical protein MKX08_008125 [Trichoderma sp. CBMAI-0020]|nr:hypothetical protein MKX08_008125 [Trichoderma sp. CBMAI-0020]